MTIYFYLQNLTENAGVTINPDYGIATPTLVSPRKVNLVRTFYIFKYNFPGYNIHKKEKDDFYIS